MKKFVFSPLSEQVPPKTNDDCWSLNFLRDQKKCVARKEAGATWIWQPSINQSIKCNSSILSASKATVCSSQAPRPAFLVTVLEHSLPHDLSLDTLRHLPVLQAKQRTAGHLRSRRQQVGRGFHLAIKKLDHWLRSKQKECKRQHHRSHTGTTNIHRS